MFAYLVRRLAYAVPILIGVNLLTFYLFFVVNSPDDMARLHLGVKRVTPEAIEKWKTERGYDKPLLYNADANAAGRLTDTIFFEKSLRLFAFNFGRSDDDRDIGRDIRQRMWPSLAIAIPVLLVGLLIEITFALLPGYLCRCLRRGPVRGPDVRLGHVLHHRWPVPAREAAAADADLGL
jgi:peptide/nickel transport system permease protein